VHFEVGVFPEPIDLDQHPTHSNFLAPLGATVIATLPARSDQGPEFVT
jgi:hypothetical protein